MSKDLPLRSFGTRCVFTSPGFSCAGSQGCSGAIGHFTSEVAVVATKVEFEKERVLAEAIGSSFEESDTSVETLSIADETEETLLLLKAIEEKAELDLTSAVGEGTEEDISSVYDFSEDVLPQPKVEMKRKVEVEKRCCDSLCSLMEWPNDVLQRLKTISSKSTKLEIKQSLLDHLHNQSKLGVVTHGFLFGGKFFCRKGFCDVSGVSCYLVREVFKAFSQGQVKFVHGNEIGFRETEATQNFTVWMKSFAHNFGNYAPDEEVIVLSSCFTLKDIFDIYISQSPSPHIKKSYFYELFRAKFGPKRLDRTLPRLRISKFSKHSKCDQCLLLDRFQRSCKGEDQHTYAKSLKQAHRQDFVRARLAIEEHRQSALTDPENNLFLQVSVISSDFDSRLSKKKTCRCTLLTLKSL